MTIKMNVALVSLSLPVEVARAVEDAAAVDRRSVSNFILVALEANPAVQAALKRVRANEGNKEGRS